MNVKELVEQLSALPPDLEVATGYPAVTQGEELEYQQSLCRAVGATRVQLAWDTWLGRDFVLIEIIPEIVLG